MGGISDYKLPRSRDVPEIGFTRNDLAVNAVAAIQQHEQFARLQAALAICLDRGVEFFAFDVAQCFNEAISGLFFRCLLPMRL